jgi:hypothetical protein
MRRIIIGLSLLIAACATQSGAPAVEGTCPPEGYDRARLEALKAGEWAIPEEQERNAFARALTACLGAVDPTLRDGLAFEGLQHMMRSRQLSAETMMALQDELEARLQGPEGEGFSRPFAALVLAEVARADRIAPYLSPERRTRLVNAAANYLRGITDYRGFDEREGWRHGVAHGSDLALQLALNPALEKPDLTTLRDAIATQVSPTGHAYVFGESERLMTPILFMARRGVFTEEEWSAWFREVASPAPFHSWEGTFTSAPMLRKRHNLALFLTSTYASAQLSENQNDDTLLEGVVSAMRAVP